METGIWSGMSSLTISSKKLQFSKILKAKMTRSNTISDHRLLLRLGWKLSFRNFSIYPMWIEWLTTNREVIKYSLSVLRQDNKLENVSVLLQNNLL